jgi:chromosome segregation protein
VGTGIIADYFGDAKMQLSKIKMSGFKSFVDPTTLDLPSQLVAVVGPNGCGKSNIIDAITWVMGESSPKYLRGEASTDVIFNGSTGRKPVGQASVELVFDNTEGTISGEYAKFAEISVKRQINREADSSYFLNGVRCRKRDVVDIFLGTGLGPRSYSIIGQNMITRMIEAKPDDLRTYLEEAAGISKYKERRHETELRINHTKENLARLNDVRAELEKQLAHLQQQANTAEKYKVLKQQERTLRGEVYAIQWRHLDSLMVDHTLNIQREETALEARNSELSKTTREMDEMRQEQRTAKDAFQEVQRRYYAAGNEITRIEQDILHHQERQQQWETDIRQAESDWEAINSQIADAEETLHELEYEIQTVEPQVSGVEKEVSLLQEELENAEDSSQDWQNRWDAFNQTSSATAQTAQVEKTHIQHLEQSILSLQKRYEQIQRDQGQYNLEDLQKEIDNFSMVSSEIEDELESFNQQLQDTRDKINALQAAQQSANQQLDQVRGESQRLRGQQASLEALQQTALGQRDHSTAPWMKEHNLGHKPRLAQNIEVEKGWELAVEKALGCGLQAICVDEVNEVVPHLDYF